MIRIDFVKRKPLFIKILTALLLISLCCLSLPSILFWRLCRKQDRDIPTNTEVIVSACARPRATGVPGGEVLFVREIRTRKTYLLDLKTDEKRAVPNDPLLLDRGEFLSSVLVWLEGSLVQPGHINYQPHYILDLNDGTRYELLDLDWLPRLEGGKFDPKYFAYFQSAEWVFLHHSKKTVIALTSDFRTNQNGRVIFSEFSLGHVTSNKTGDLLEHLMKDLEVDYQIVDFSLYHADVPSPTGRYMVRGDGIYLAGTNTLVMDRDMGFYFRGWYYDESGVVFQEGGTYLIKFPEAHGYYPTPIPILKLRIPAP